MQRLIIIWVLIFIHFESNAQVEFYERKKEYTRQDSLRGSITSEREWWDLKHYDLSVAVDPEKKFISGINTISYEVLKEQNVMQIDLQAPMRITKVTYDKKELEVIDERNAHFIKLPKQTKGEFNKVSVYFEGNPRPAIMAPWDGGFSWKKDENGKHFIATSNQGIGASLWWPCKDHMYDEPENGIRLSITAPEDLIAVGNGRLKETIKNADKTKTFVWEVVNPINNYGVNVNIGDYVNISSTYAGLKGTLDVDFWVLKDNEDKAREHFKDAYLMLEAFEYWFGPYPFYEDSYKLVDVPYLGMEHQSSVTYGNQYKKGFLGRDMSGTGWGLKWDFIIIHESVHEWFANSITYKDAADMWLHEGFAAYAGSLFIEYFHGKEAGDEFAIGMQKNCQNQETIIGDYGVNRAGSSDMYTKGHSMLHTIRQIINNDEKWRQILIGLNKDFYHQTVTSAQIEAYISEKSGVDFSKVFDQYLRDIRVPVLEYHIKEGKLMYRWTNTMAEFDMPIRARIEDEDVWLKPTTTFTDKEIGDSTIEFDDNFYVYTFKLKH